jgi:hypothetical protein
LINLFSFEEIYSNIHTTRKGNFQEPTIVLEADSGRDRECKELPPMSMKTATRTACDAPKSAPCEL